MFGNFLSVALLMMGLMSCAKPQYVERKSPQNPEGNEKLSFQCQAQFKKSQFCAQIFWTKTPTDKEVGSFLVRVFALTGPDQFPVLRKLPQALSVELWMPSMGHGSSPVSVQELETDGSYQAEKVFFIMPGPWEIRLQQKDAQGLVDEAILAIEI